MSTSDRAGRPAASPTELGLPLGDRLLLVVGAPGLGLVLGYFVPRVTKWVVARRWLPMRGPFKLIDSFDDGTVLLVSLLVGAVGGIAFAFVAIADLLKVTLTDTEIRLDRNERSRTVPRSEVDAVFLDGKQLVVLDRESRQLVRESQEARPAEVGRAFRAHGYPWLDGDPYVELYRRWVPDTPDLPATVNAVLAARGIALKQRVARDVAELRDEVQKCGFVVRDEGDRQYWRPLVRS